MNVVPAMGSGGNGVAAEKPLNGTFQALPTTIFTVMTDLAIQHKSINLGQGFPDDEGPASMKVVERCSLSTKETCRARKSSRAEKEVSTNAVMLTLLNPADVACRTW